MRFVRLALGLAPGLVACGATTAQQAETTHLIVPAGTPVKGGVVRVEVAHAPVGIARYANVWRHVDNDQSERLEITADGRFDWKIERPQQNTCQIAGTVTIREDKVNAMRWVMLTNTCNSSYEGKVSFDWIIQTDRHHLALVDAEFHGDPVPYDLTTGQEGLQPDHVDPPTDELHSFQAGVEPDPPPLP